MRRYLNNIILFFCTPMWLMGQNLLPPIQNYRIFDYKADSKNWGLSVSPNGELFVANNKGLLHFNGEEWLSYELPNKTIIRSVAHINGKVYTGSYEEFGFWKENQIGKLEYTSLIHLIDNQIFTNEEFWQIIPYNDTIVFRSFSGIYIYKDDSIKVINPHFVVTRIIVHENKILVAGGHSGLYWLSGETLIPQKEGRILDGKIVVDMDITGDGLLIGTKLHGCYYLKNGSLQELNPQVNAELKQYQLNQILPLADGKIAFGTIKNGVYFFDPEKETYQTLNRETGLQNNTVLDLLQFKEQLWIGLDNGIDRIKLNNPLKYYTDYSGVIGTVYDIAHYKGTLYLGSNTGIYYFQDDVLKFVEGSQGHVWDMEVVEDDLLCGHNIGTFKLKNGELKKVSDNSGGYSITKAPETSSTFIQGTYTGLVKYIKDKQGNWKVEPVKGGVRFPVKYLCFEDANTLWIAHSYKGLYQIKMNSTHDLVTDIKEFGPESIPNNYNIKLFNLKNQIVLFSEGIWYKYDPILDKIILFEEFQEFNHKDLVGHYDGHYWFIDNEGGKEITRTDLKGNRFVIDDEHMKKRLVRESENVIKVQDSVYLFTLADGFAEIKASTFEKNLQMSDLPAPKLYSFQDEEKEYPISKDVYTIPYQKSQHLTLKVSTASLIQPHYYIELQGTLDQQQYTENGTISFQNLPFGEYELSVFTIGTNNERSTPKKIHFEISPPWYLSKLFIAIYVFGIIGIVFLIRWFNKWKLEKKHQKLKEKLHRQQEEHLARLEKEKLAKEIKLKQKELASTTMNVAKKNELILELKNLLLMNKDKFSNKQRYRSFIKKLNSSINDDSDWRHFEVNFKELHEDFFENLLKLYPRLTPKDLKLCAYLKMNLSSKEIAPLMGITTRGVEIHRYRLRKKLNIESSQNLSNFLIKLN